MLPIGIVLVDAEFHILHSNTVAQKMLTEGEPIVSQFGQLRGNCTKATAALLAAAKQVTHVEGRTRLDGIDIPWPYLDGRAAVAHVRPLHLARDGSSTGTATVIFIAEATQHAPPPINALRILFNLTWSEVRVLEQIVSGRNRRETAAVLGIADSTVKTHLDHVYSKTRTSDQLGLCRLVAMLSWTNILEGPHNFEPRPLGTA